MHLLHLKAHVLIHTYNAFHLSDKNVYLDLRPCSYYVNMKPKINSYKIWNDMSNDMHILLNLDILYSSISKLGINQLLKDWLIQVDY